MIIKRTGEANIKRPQGTLKKYLIKTHSKKEQKTLDKAYCSVGQYTLYLQNGKDHRKKTSSGFT